MWPCANDGDAEKNRADLKATLRLVLQERFVARLTVEELHDLNWIGRHAVRTVVRVVEESAKRPRWAPADLRAGIGVSILCFKDRVQYCGHRTLGGVVGEVKEADAEGRGLRRCTLQFGCCAV